MAERSLFKTEIQLAVPVFMGTLPYHLIRIKDDLGLFDRAWCEPGVLGNFILHMGPVGFAGCWQTIPIRPEGSPVNAVFIHELVHAWQGFHGLNYVWNSLATQCSAVFAAGGIPGAYQYEVGRIWSAYNVEQQGNIVEDWYRLGMSTANSRYPYIRDNIRRGLIAP